MQPPQRETGQPDEEVLDADQRRGRWQFGLRGLFAVITMLTVLLAIIQYIPDGPELFLAIVRMFGGFLALGLAYCVLIAVPQAAILWVVKHWKRPGSGP